MFFQIWSQPIFELDEEIHFLNTMKNNCSTWSMHETWQFENKISIGRGYVFHALLLAQLLVYHQQAWVCMDFFVTAWKHTETKISLLFGDVAIMIFISHSYVFCDLKPIDFRAASQKLIIEHNENRMLNMV